MPQIDLAVSSFRSWLNGNSAASEAVRLAGHARGFVAVGSCLVCARGRVRLAAFVLAALVGRAPIAHGQPAQASGADALATLGYEAPASCPDRAGFLERIEARTQTARSPDPARPPPRLRVRIRVLAGRVLGSISIEHADGAVAGRQIRAATCDEAADALALIAALALDPDRRAESLGADTPTDDARTEGVTGDERADDATARGQPERSTQDAPEDRDASEDDSDGISFSEDAEQTDASPGIASQRLVLAASAFALWGVLPDATPAFAFFAAYAIEPRGLPELALRAGFAIAPEASEEHAQGVAEFAFWSALLALCSGVRDARDTASLWLCAAGEVGQLAASGTLTLDPQSEDRSWAALGPALVAQWEPLRPLLVQAGAGALFALVRDRFLLGNDTVHRAPGLGVRVDLGVGIRIW